MNIIRKQIEQQTENGEIYIAESLIKRACKTPASFCDVTVIVNQDETIDVVTYNRVSGKSLTYHYSPDSLGRELEYYPNV